MSHAPQSQRRPQTPPRQQPKPSWGPYASHARWTKARIAPINGISDVFSPGFWNRRTKPSHDGLDAHARPAHGLSLVHADSANSSARRCYAAEIQLCSIAKYAYGVVYWHDLTSHAFNFLNIYTHTHSLTLLAFILLTRRLYILPRHFCLLSFFSF